MVTRPDPALSWSRMPLSAPRWMWALYVLAMVVLAAIAQAGWGLFAVAITAQLSFLFWTIVAHRGMTRARETGDDSS